MQEAIPYQVHTILTDRAIGSAIGSSPMARGIQFAEQPRNRNTIHSRPMRFDMISEVNGIEHRLIKPNHPCSHEEPKTVRRTVFPRGGQVERMNRTIKEATVKRYHYDSHDQLGEHLADFLLRRGQQSDELSSIPSSPATSHEGSRRQTASHPTNTSAKPGHQSRSDSS